VSIHSLYCVPLGRSRVLFLVIGCSSRMSLPRMQPPPSLQASAARPAKPKNLIGALLAYHGLVPNPSRSAATTRGASGAWLLANAQNSSQSAAVRLTAAYIPGSSHKITLRWLRRPSVSVSPDNTRSGSRKEPTSGFFN
jgi:hypothetical protein